MFNTIGIWVHMKQYQLKPLTINMTIKQTIFTIILWFSIIGLILFPIINDYYSKQHNAKQLTTKEEYMNKNFFIKNFLQYLD